MSDLTSITGLVAETKPAEMTCFTRELDNAKHYPEEQCPLKDWPSQDQLSLLTFSHSYLTFASHFKSSHPMSGHHFVPPTDTRPRRSNGPNLEIRIRHGTK